MGEQKIAKVTISLPEKVLKIVDRIAIEKSTSRSSIIVKLVEQEEQARIRVLMAEGYSKMAEENRKLAEDSFPLVSELMLKNSRWDKIDGQTR